MSDPPLDRTLQSRARCVAPFHLSLPVVLSSVFCPLLAPQGTIGTSCGMARAPTPRVVLALELWVWQARRNFASGNSGRPRCFECGAIPCQCRLFNLSSSVPIRLVRLAATKNTPPLRIMSSSLPFSLDIQQLSCVKCTSSPSCTPATKSATSRPTRNATVRRDCADFRIATHVPHVELLHLCARSCQQMPGFFCLTKIVLLAVFGKGTREPRPHCRS